MTDKKNYLKQYLLQENKIKRLTEMIIKKPNEVAKWENEIKACENLRKEIEDKISKIDDPVLSELLYEKYILGKTLEEISFDLNYSIRQIERLHIKALEKIDIC